MSNKANQPGMWPNQIIRIPTAKMRCGILLPAYYGIRTGGIETSIITNLRNTRTTGEPNQSIRKEIKRTCEGEIPRATSTRSGFVDVLMNRLGREGRVDSESSEWRHFRDSLERWMQEQKHHPHPRMHTLEVIAALLLSVATVASAWSAYQSTRWSGLQSILFGEANTDRIESSRSTNNANRQVTIHVGLFVRYAAALSENNNKLADFLYQRFPPPLRKATDAWLKTDPLKNPRAPSSPFGMKEYSLEDERQAQELGQLAKEKFEAAKQANQTSDNYVLLTVLFASVLFFSGMSTKFESLKIRAAMLLMGAIIFCVALGFVAYYPIY